MVPSLGWQPETKSFWVKVKVVPSGIHFSPVEVSLSKGKLID